MTVLVDNWVISYGMPTNRLIGNRLQYFSNFFTAVATHLGNRLLDDDSLSPRDQQTIGKVQQNNRCTPLALHCKALEWLQPVCAVAYTLIPRATTQIDEQDAMQSDIVSSTSWPAPRNTARAILHDVTEPPSCKASAIVFCVSLKPFIV